MKWPQRIWVNIMTGDPTLKIPVTGQRQLRKIFETSGFESGNTATPK